MNKIKSIRKEDLRAQNDTELKKQEARRKIFEIANAHGINLAEMVRKECRYRNPDNPWKLWNGRGRRPKWINQWLASGRLLEELKV